jgi:ATP-dependent DNA helicase RecG
MALAINIEALLNKQKIESNRIEFKKGWNPASIYHSVCAFANDFDDLGGGYILVGVDSDDNTGMAIRPVEGVPVEKIDGILQEMVGYSNKMSPYYMPRTSLEEVDVSYDYKDTNHVIRVSTVNLNQDWHLIEQRLKDIIQEQKQ